MSATSTSTSYTISIAQTGTASGTFELSTDAMQLSVSMETGNTADPGALGAELLSDAVAVGEDTFASISASGTGSDTGGIATVHGSLSAEAIAESAEGAFASASAWIGLLGDAEVIFTLSFSAFSMSQTDDSSATSASAVSVLFAMTTSAAGVSAEFPPDGALTDDGLDQQPVDPCGCGGNSEDPDLDGNIAVFEVDLVALGQDTYVAVDVTAFAIEDEISSVTVAATVALG